MIQPDTNLRIGSLLFEGFEQIDLTNRSVAIPNSTYRLYGKTAEPVRDINGLRLIPDAALADAPQFDVLHVPGFGQEALMEDDGLPGWLHRHTAGAHAAAGEQNLDRFRTWQPDADPPDQRAANTFAVCWSNAT